MSTAVRETRQKSIAYDVAAVRRDFPILAMKVYGKPLVYLDNAASAQKPSAVIEAERRVYETCYANIHRGVHWLSVHATDAYDAAREKARAFLNAAAAHEIVFVRGTTEAVNLVAQTLGRRRIGAGDEVLITGLEHHSNIVPWQMLCEETGGRLAVAPLTEEGEVDLAAFERLLSPRTRIVSVAHLSNALGTVLPVRRIAELAHSVGAVVFVDGAQAAPRMPVDVRALDCDFYAFSSHKIYGPTGVGVLYGKTALLEAMPPYQGGGDMIRSVTFEKTTYNELPYKFEAGTPNIAGGIAFGAALDYVGGAGPSGDRGARAGHPHLRDRGALRDSGPARGRHGAREGGGPVLRARRHPPARHRHGARPRGRGDPDRSPLRAAGHGPLRPAGDRAGVLRPVQHARRGRCPRRGDPQSHRDVPLMSSDLRDLYQEVILDHSKRPRNFHALAGANRQAEGYNPLCGDRETVYLALDGDRLRDVAFQGAGCAISTASASMMTESVKGKTRAEAEALFERFHDLITGQRGQADGAPDLGKLEVFSGVREYPVRVKCATLPWHTLKAALQSDGATVSTESEGPHTGSGGA